MKKILFYCFRGQIRLLLMLSLGAAFEIVLIQDVIAFNESQIINTPDSIPVPHTTYPLLYTMHAKKAVIIKENKNNYTLVLHDLYSNVNYKFFISNNVSGIVELDKFITMWQSKGNVHVEADVTGLQRDNKTIGHSQFYIRALLSHPKYTNTLSNELRFTLTITSPKLDISKIVYMENISIFINACNLCSCNNVKITCNNESSRINMP